MCMLPVSLVFHEKTIWQICRSRTRPTRCLRCGARSGSPLPCTSFLTWSFCDCWGFRVGLLSIPAYSFFSLAVPFFLLLFSFFGSRFCGGQNPGGQNFENSPPPPPSPRRVFRRSDRVSRLEHWAVVCVCYSAGFALFVCVGCRCAPKQWL